MSAVKEVIRISPESAAHQKYSGALSDKYIFARMKQWIEDGDKGITLTHILTRFKTYPTRALWLLHKFYSEYHEECNLRRGWFIQPEVKKDVDEDGNVIEYTGRTATEAEIMEYEKDGKKVSKRLFCIHPAKLDTIDYIDFFNCQRMDSVIGKHASPIALKNNAAAIKQEREEEKLKTEAKMDKLFAKECERPKIASPGKKKDPSPIKPKDQFFAQNIKKKDEKPPSRKRMDFAKDDIVADDPMMEDVFTTGDDDIEDFEVEPVVSSKKTSSRPRKIAKIVTPEPSEDVEMEEVGDAEDDEEEDEPGPSQKIKELRTVQETTKDDEGFLVTNTSKKMIETDKIAPPQSKKKNPTFRPAPPKKGTKAAVPKQQSTLTDFFKKK